MFLQNSILLPQKDFIFYTTFPSVQETNVHIQLEFSSLIQLEQEMQIPTLSTNDWDPWSTAVL